MDYVKKWHENLGIYKLITVYWDLVVTDKIYRISKNRQIKSNLSRSHHAHIPTILICISEKTQFLFH